MSSERRRIRPLQSASLGLATILTVSVVIGCDSGQQSGVVKDEAPHGKEVSKNMENFMKGQPYKNVGKTAEKVQMK